MIAPDAFHLKIAENCPNERGHLSCVSRRGSCRALSEGYRLRHAQSVLTETPCIRRIGGTGHYCAEAAYHGIKHRRPFKHQMRKRSIRQFPTCPACFGQQQPFPEMRPRRCAFRRSRTKRRCNAPTTSSIIFAANVQGCSSSIRQRVGVAGMNLRLESAAYLDHVSSTSFPLASFSCRCSRSFSDQRKRDPRDQSRRLSVDQRERAAMRANDIVDDR